VIKREWLIPLLVALIAVIVVAYVTWTNLPLPTTTLPVPGGS
jgi:hypothetical protein